MSKTRDARGNSDADAKSSPPVETPPPLQPRRGLFIALGVLLLAALGAMLWLYFTTVYASRH